MKIVGATGLGGLWAVEYARHIRVTNLRYKATESEIPILSLIDSEISAFILTIFSSLLAISGCGKLFFWVNRYVLMKTINFC